MFVEVEAFLQVSGCEGSLNGFAPGSRVLGGVLGYRYEPLGGGFQFRVGFAPMYALLPDSEEVDPQTGETKTVETDSTTIPFPYMSFGYAF